MGHLVFCHTMYTMCVHGVADDVRFGHQIAWEAVTSIYCGIASFATGCCHYILGSMWFIGQPQNTHRIDHFTLKIVQNGRFWVRCHLGGYGDSQIRGFCVILYIERLRMIMFNKDRGLGYLPLSLAILNV